MSEVRPFSNGCQAADWADRNCANCRKSWDEAEPDVFPCDIEKIVNAASFDDDGKVSKEIADRMGKPEGVGPYCWDCPERETNT